MIFLVDFFIAFCCFTIGEAGTAHVRSQSVKWDDDALYSCAWNMYTFSNDAIFFSNRFIILLELLLCVSENKL